MTERSKDTIASMQYARIIAAMVEMYGITMEEAIDLFYNSETFGLIEDHIADLHCRSDKYLAEEVWREHLENNQIRPHDKA